MISRKMILSVNVKLLAAYWLGLGLISGPFGLTQAVELSGNIAGEYRYFQHDSPFSEPGQYAPSLAFSPEFYTEWDGGRKSLIISPFLRVDAEDAQRSHADLREFQWLLAEDDWELHLGIGKVFWGVTESQHLVDVINQTDLIENSDTEEKLGQPMINLSLFQDWGIVDLFVMPYFRERTFAGRDGRFRGLLVVDTDAAKYQSGAGRQHIDLAVRWSHSLDDWDIGLSHFYGTNREPLLLLNSTASALIPFYETMHQTGLEAQYTSEAWLWKLEMIRRETDADTFSALTGGVEYTFYSVFESNIDVGLLAEYLFDDRNNAGVTAFEDDVLIGTRLTWNDAQSSELLFGLIQDMSSQDIGWNIEASRRIGNRWKVSLEGRFFSVDDRSSVLFPVRDDDYLQLELARYF
jgi:hypothetical protein